MSDENELLYEMQTFVIFIIAMCTQYLNLFRTYWWQSDTYRRYAMVRTRKGKASLGFKANNNIFRLTELPPDQP